MIYLYGYLGSGMVGLILVLAFDWVVKKSDSLWSHFLHPTEKFSVPDWLGLALMGLLILLI
jgi:hypothetical protein